MDAWEKQGGKVWQLIEPVDGFHANQQGQALTAAAVWDELMKTVPASLGELNPNNDWIKSVFGDQGGL